MTKTTLGMGVLLVAAAASFLTVFAVIDRQEVDAQEYFSPECTLDDLHAAIDAHEYNITARWERGGETWETFEVYCLVSSEPTAVPTATATPTAVPTATATPECDKHTHPRHSRRDLRDTTFCHLGKHLPSAGDPSYN